MMHGTTNIKFISISAPKRESEQPVPLILPSCSR